MLAIHILNNNDPYILSICMGKVEKLKEWGSCFGCIVTTNQNISDGSTVYRLPSIVGAIYTCLQQWETHDFGINIPKIISNNSGHG